MIIKFACKIMYFDEKVLIKFITDNSVFVFQYFHSKRRMNDGFKNSVLAGNIFQE